MSRVVKLLKIGPLVVDPPVLQAPMAGYTNYAFRQMVRRFGGAGLLATEMVSARGFLEMDRRGGGLPDRLWGVVDEARPLAVQIWDNDPDDLAAVGRRLAREFHVSVVDINFGCPVREVSEKAKSGSYLLRYPNRIGEIVARVVEACAPVPVTAKIRLGCTAETANAVEVARTVEAAGGAAVTVHGRSAAQGLRGRADWDRIAEVKAHLHRIPLIGNGDLTTAAGAVEAFRRYGVDGVMIGRAALGRPWLFRQVEAALAGRPPRFEQSLAEQSLGEPSLAEQKEVLLDHYRLIVERFGPTKGTILMRRYACHYVQGRPGARAFRGYVSRVKTPEEFAAAVWRHLPDDGA